MRLVSADDPDAIGISLNHRTSGLIQAAAFVCFVLLYGDSLFRLFFLSSFDTVLPGHRENRCTEAISMVRPTQSNQLPLTKVGHNDSKRSTVKNAFFTKHFRPMPQHLLALVTFAASRARPQIATFWAATCRLVTARRDSR